jgi:hypothetical protein
MGTKGKALLKALVTGVSSSSDFMVVESVMGCNKLRNVSELPAYLLVGD